jgi:hypothetical protein
VFCMGIDIRRQFRHEVRREREDNGQREIGFRIVRAGESDDAGQVVLLMSSR